MRSCIYCGKELKDKELCDCRTAVLKRMEKEKREYTEKKNENAKTYYRTGYTKKDNRIKHFIDRLKSKYYIRKNQRQHAVNSKTGKSIFHYILNVMKDPINAVGESKAFTWGEMVIISLVQGALILGLGVLCSLNGGLRRFPGFSLMVPEFSGSLLIDIIFAIILGGVIGIAGFLLYALAFYLVSRFILRSYSSFKDISNRLVLITLVNTVFSILGILISPLSFVAFILLQLGGMMSTIILTYKSMCREWSGISESRVFYFTILAYFILFMVVSSIIRTSLILL